MPNATFKTNPRFWGVGFLVWFIVLCLLSHGDRFHPPLPIGFFDFANSDKVMHFGFFFGGAGLLSALLHFSRDFSTQELTLIVTIALSIIGVADEFHQSFFENRRGNDPGDWFADTLGAFFGTLVFRYTYRFLLKLPNQENPPQTL
ncbi:MAG: VanZ family protein [Akkermansiaceae bacterium]